MKCKEIFEKIDELSKKYYKVWEDCCNIESPSDLKSGVDAVGNYFAGLASSFGWKVEIFEQKTSGNVVCITMNPDSKERPVCLSGHIDTVHPVGIFGSPAVRFDDEKIYGPGVSDCKGGVVSSMLAMQALAECGFTKRPVKLLLQSDEEKSSMPSGKATISYICEQSEDAIAFLNMESHGEGFATTSRKGIVSYEFTVVGKEGHSSRCVTEGANAIVDASHKIIELDKLKDNDGITCNCAIVNGGTVVNTIPGLCVFAVNFRFATKEQFEWIQEYVEKLAGTVHVPGTHCSVKETSHRVAMEKTEANLNLLARANEIFAENGLPTLVPRALRGGSDGSDVTAHGIPCMDSQGVVGGGTHSVNEFAYLYSLADSAKRAAAIVFCI